MSPTSTPLPSLLYAAVGGKTYEGVIKDCEFTGDIHGDYYLRITAWVTGIAGREFDTIPISRKWLKENLTPEQLASLFTEKLTT